MILRHFQRKMKLEDIDEGGRMEWSSRLSCFPGGLNGVTQ